MSRKRKNPAPSHTSAPAPESAPSQFRDSEVPETTGNYREIEISALTFRQQATLPVVAVSRTLAQAARDSGVSEKTLRKWLEDPSFHSELDRLRQESYQMARKQLQAALPHCIAMLAEIAAECDDPAIRLRAIRTLMTYGVKFGDFDKLADDLRDLRAALRDGK